MRPEPAHFFLLPFRHGMIALSAEDTYPQRKSGPTPDCRRARVTAEEAKHLADHWIAAWNAHNIDAIMSHYDDAVELISPTAARLLSAPDGKVTGKAALRAYFTKGLEAFPDLRFELKDLLFGMNSVVLYYLNQKGTRTAEFMELSQAGRVVRVVANYSA
jgi:predicted ester cyclase